MGTAEGNAARLAQAIQDRFAATRERPLLVAIDGPGGSGKSTLATQTRDLLTIAGITTTSIPFDDFLVKEHCFDDDWELAWDRQRLVAEVLQPLRAGQPAAWHTLIWDPNVLSDPTPVPDCDVLIIEGISTLHPTLRDWWHLSAWVDVPIEVSSQRGAARDAVLGHRDVDWDRWAESDRRYQAAHEPRAAADLVLANDAA